MGLIDDLGVGFFLKSGTDGPVWAVGIVVHGLWGVWGFFGLVNEVVEEGLLGVDLADLLDLGFDLWGGCLIGAIREGLHKGKSILFFIIPA